MGILTHVFRMLSTFSHSHDGCSRPWFIGEFGDQGQPHDILKQDVQAVQKQTVKTRVPQVLRHFNPDLWNVEPVNSGTHVGHA